MRPALFLFTATVSAHTIFHEALVNGKSQGQLFGIRAPAANNPILDVSSSAITCNTGLNQPISKDVIQVAPGDKFGTQWNHLITGAQGQGDSDDPIASSHKGPISIYMAKVADAASSNLSGLKFFKIVEQGLDTASGKWAVDDLIANKGLWSFTMPALTAGDYIMRAELIGLHEANRQSGAQFYVSCANVRVTGSGTCNPSNTISLPGAYSASDPGILVSGIYGSSGKPDNGGKAYTPPGPRPITCAGSSSSNSGESGLKPVTTGVKVATTSTDAAVTTTRQNSTLPSTFATVTTSRMFSNTTTTRVPAASTAGTSKWQPWVSGVTTVAPVATSTNSSRAALPTSRPVKPSGTGPVPGKPSPPLNTGPTKPPADVPTPSGTGPAPVKPSPPLETGAPEPPTGQVPSQPGTGPKPPTESGVEGVIGDKKYVCYEASD